MNTIILIHPDTGEDVSVEYEQEVQETISGEEYPSHRIEAVKTMGGMILWNGRGEIPEFVGELTAELDGTLDFEDFVEEDV